MSENPVAIGISTFAALLSLFSFWYTTLRGPKIGPVGETLTGDQMLIPDIRSFTDFTRIPFEVITTLANSGSSSGLIRNPNVIFRGERTLDTNVQVALQSLQLRPVDSQKDWVSRGLVWLIPAYSVTAISFVCHVGLVSWDRLPTMDRFSVGCHISRIHEEYFDSKREEALRVLSKLEQSRKLGTLGIRLETTERSLFGRFHWKERLVLSEVEVAFSPEFSFSEVIGLVGSWRSENQSSVYLSFLEYVGNRGRAIRDTLDRKDPDANSTVFPTSTSEDQRYAIEVLCICDREFSELWKALSLLEGNWPGIVTMLREQKRGRKLSNKDEQEIRDLQTALEKVLEKCSSLRSAIVEDFKLKR